MSKWLTGRDPLTGRKVGLNYSLEAIHLHQQELLRPQLVTSTQAIAFIQKHNVHCLSRNDPEDYADEISCAGPLVASG